MIRLRAGNRHGAGSTPASYSETISPALRDPACEIAMSGRVVAIDPAAEHADRHSSGVECSSVGLTVDPACEAAHHHEACAGQLAREGSCHRPAVGRTRPRADDRDRRPAEQLSRSPRHGARAPGAGRGSPPVASDTGRYHVRRRRMFMSRATPPASDTRAPRPDARGARRQPAPALPRCGRPARHALARDRTAERAQRRDRAARTPPLFA